MTIQHLYPTTRPSLDLNFAQQKRLDPRVTFTRGSTATYVGSDGLIKTAASGEARIEKEGLMIEESRTNLITHSEDTTQSAWSQPRSTSTVGGTAPDGTNTANNVTVTVTGSNGSVNQTFTLSGSVSYSVFIKKKGFNNFRIGCSSNAADNIYYDIDTDTFSFQGSNVNNPQSNVFADGWVRISAVFTLPSPAVARNYLVFVTDNPNSTYTTVNGTDGFYMWGAQVETGAFPTSYIPTSGSTVTRSADLASITGTNFSSWYNQSEGSFVFDAPELLRTLANQPVLSTTSSAPTEGIQFWNSSGSAVRLRVYEAGNLEVNFSGSIYEGAAWGWGYETDNTSLFKDGATITTDTSCAMPTAATSLSIGNNGKKLISRLTYYPYRLTDAQLQALTL